MKKNEMICLICDFIEKGYNSPCMYDTVDLLLESSRLLDKILEAGMLPPCMDCVGGDDLCGRRECSNLWKPEEGEHE